jgi:GR25 family glycosyltransferase involved in LPS biosynthesis
MNMFCAKSDEVCLVLEDDFVFLDDRTHVWSSIAELFANPVDFNICFLSLSKTGLRLPHNSLLSKTLQPCTTSSGYFLQKSTAPTVYETAAEGLELMKRTGNHHDFCIDRYWTKLPKLFFFRKKLGFQRPAYSNLIGGVVAHLD